MGPAVAAAPSRRTTSATATAASTAASTIGRLPRLPKRVDRRAPAERKGHTSHLVPVGSYPAGERDEARLLRAAPSAWILAFNARWELALGERGDEGIGTLALLRERQADYLSLRW